MKTETTVNIFMKVSYIYLTTNTINGKQYIGKHVGSTNDRYIGSGALLNKAIQKYGKANFKKEILEITDRELLQERENFWLRKYDAANNPNFYNISPSSSDTAGWGHKTPIEKKAIIKKMVKGRAQKMSVTKQKIKETIETWSEETKAANAKRCSESSKKYWAQFTAEERKERNNSNGSVEALRKAEKKRLAGIKKHFQSLSAEEKYNKARHLIGKNKGIKMPSSAKEKISKSVSEYYEKLSAPIKQKRAKKISKAISSLKWCNDGITNFRKPIHVIEESGYTLGQI